MAESKNTRELPKPEGIEENYVEYTRYDDSKKWVDDNTSQFRQSLLDHRSGWQKFVDWAHTHPLPALLLTLSLLVLFVSAVLLPVFFAGMPVLFMAIGLTLAIALPLFTSLGIAFSQTSYKPIEDFISGLPSQYAHTYTLKERQERVKNALDLMGDRSMRAEATKIVEEQKRQFATKVYNVPAAIKVQEKLRKVLQDAPENFPLKEDFPLGGRPKGEKNDYFRFSDGYSLKPNYFEIPEDAQNKVIFFVHFIQEIFGIKLKYPTKGDEAGITTGYNPVIHGSYYTDISGVQLDKMIDSDITQLRGRAKEFYDHWKATQENIKTVRSCEHGIIAALTTWAQDDRYCQDVVRNVEKELLKVRDGLKIIKSTNGVFEWNFCIRAFKGKIIDDDTKANYDEMKAHLNKVFGKDTCTVGYSTFEETTGTELKKNESVRIDLKIRIKPTEVSTREEPQVQQKRIPILKT